MANLVWFRSDLRTQDNSALRYALDSGQTLACAFLPVKQLMGYGHGERKIRFLREAFKQLSYDLKSLGVELIYAEIDYFEDQNSAVTDLCKKHEIHHVYWNNEYPLDERNRDNLLEKILSEFGVQVQRFNDSLILPPDQISTKQGDFYKVYTPFKRAWLTQFEQNRPELLNKLELIKKPTDAIHQLNEFIEGPINSYKSSRDFPAQNGTSHLSSSLSIGTISPLRALAEVLASNQGEASEGSPEISTWISQIIWREFYYHLIARCDRLSQNQPFIESTKALNWNNPATGFDQWKQGITGIPIVDAGMRQLFTTGWMHNRLRMITAMFLTKNLFIDWRLGEKHFLEHLEDGDFALNNGGWQWSASTGTDAVPYFRVFNPFSQAARFDTEAKFIKQFVPELASLPANIIHNESKLALHRPASYPGAIVNTSTSRKAAISAFKNI